MSSTRHGVRSRHTDINRRSHGAFDVPLSFVGSGGPTSPSNPQEVRNVIQGTTEQMPAQQLGEASVSTSAIQNEAVTTEKLLLQDEFGATMLTPAGFVGSWEDYFLTGLYNGSFGDNNITEPATLGRTADCPYWTLDVEAGSGVVFSTSIGSLRADFDDLVTTATVLSDRVRVRQGIELAVFLRGVEAVGNTADVFVLAEMLAYDSSGNLIGSTNVGSADFLGDDPEQTVFLGSLVQEGVYVAIKLTIEAISLAAAGNAAVDIFEVGMFVFDSAHGDSFHHDAPGSGRRFYRDDLGMWFIHNGTAWVSEQLFELPLQRPDFTAVSATTNDYARVAVPFLQGGSDLWLENYEVKFWVASGSSALSASHKWVGALTKFVTGATGTDIVTVTIDSGSSGVYRAARATIDALLGNGTDYFIFTTDWTKTGTPGAIQPYEVLTYRVVAT